MVNIILSTNAHMNTGLQPVYEVLKKHPTVGIELFPNEKDDLFTAELENLARTSGRYLTFHGPYFDIEHSAPKGTDEYKYAMECVIKTLQLSKELGIKYFVFHHNNREIDIDKSDMIRESNKNLDEITNIANEYGVEILIENAGVNQRKNALFNEDEFIDVCMEKSNPVLIDVGHVHANGWDIERVIVALKDKIQSYHLHNNDGKHDEHNRIEDGTFDYDYFFELYKKYTPESDLILEYNYFLGNKVDEIVEDIKKVESYVK
ncbi:sugar phosphate isomerase/epimerase family protein [Macrococcus sp. CCM 2573]